MIRRPLDWLRHLREEWRERRIPEYRKRDTAIVLEDIWRTSAEEKQNPAPEVETDAGP